MKQRLLSAVSSAALLAGLLLTGVAAPVAATTSGTLDWGGQGWPNNTCPADAGSASPGDTMLWIFTAKGVSNPVLNWDTGQTAVMTTMGSGGGSFHATVPFFDPTDPANQPIFVSYDGTIDGNAVLTISGCNEGNPSGQTSTITTEIHAGATDSGTPVVVDDTTNVPTAGDTVHDSAELTFTGGGFLPANSVVQFNFYDSHDCTGDVGDTSGTIDVTGSNSPISLDPYLAEVVTAGGHSYQAVFTSGDTSKVTSSTSDCEPFNVNAAAEVSSISTEIHLNADDIAGTTVVSGPVALGSTVHDSASLTFTGGGTLPSGSNVVFKFWSGAGCPDSAATDSTSPIDVSGDSSPVPGLDPQLAEGPLAAGSYSYQAIFTSGNTNLVTSQASDCEPLTVNKGDVTIRTDIHNAAHVVVTSVLPGAIVHDTATLGGAVAGINPDMTKVAFTFYANGTCDVGTGSSVANTGTESTYVARSAASAALAPGNYAYSATFAGDDNYNAVGPATCEPLAAFNPALTPGYWKNHLANNGKTGLWRSPLCSTTTVKNDGGSCSTMGPWTIQYLPVTVGGYTVVTIVDAANIFAKMNCSSTKPNDAIGCLAGHLLAAKLNVANSSNTCINTVVAKAQAFLSGGVADGVTGINYIGPNGTYSLSSAQRAEAVLLKNALDKYNNGGGC